MSPALWTMRAGAERRELITACPLCLYNLDKNGGADKLPYTIHLSCLQRRWA